MNSLFFFDDDIFVDRCASTKCRDGETCVLNKDGDAECACIADCEDPKDERLMVNRQFCFHRQILFFYSIDLGLYKSQSYVHLRL